MNDYKLRYSYGSKGKRGIKGETGCSGVIGNYGDCGKQGIHGIKGIKGNTGIKGLTGAEGDEGQQGLTGNIGLPTTGFKGQKGEKGIHTVGYVNLDNSTIIQYNNSSVFEFKNESLKGFQGNTGITGDIGDNGSNGPIGNNGEKGIKGNIGDKGLTGSSLINISQVYLNSNYNITQTFTDNLDSFNTDLLGEKGLSGTEGDVGNSISAFITDLKYGFRLSGNSAVMFNASQINDNEFYMPKFNELFLSDRSNISSKKNFYYFDLSEPTHYASASEIFEKFLDKKIVGLFNTNDEFSEGSNILAGSIDTISPIDNVFYNQLDVSERFSRGLEIIAQGNQKYRPDSNIEGISVNLRTIINDTINGFDFNNNEYILTNNTKPTDNNKFYGIIKINNFKFYIPIKIFIRLEEHVYKGKKLTTNYKYIDNDIILEETTDINQDCASNTIQKYSDWFVVENNRYVSLTNLNWYSLNSDIQDNIKLCVRYKFSLPSNIKVGNIIDTFQTIVNNNTDLSNGELISESNDIYTDLPLINSVSNINQYNNLPNSDKNIYLPQVVSTLIPINELSCNIKTSTN